MKTFFENIFVGLNKIHFQYICWLSLFITFISNLNNPQTSLSFLKEFVMYVLLISILILSIKLLIKYEVIKQEVKKPIFESFLDFMRKPFWFVFFFVVVFNLALLILCFNKIQLLITFKGFVGWCAYNAILLYVFNGIVNMSLFQKFKNKEWKWI